MYKFPTAILHLSYRVLFARFTLAAFMLVPSILFGQVRGRVTDGKTKEVLPFTHVYNPSSGQGAYTDINGNFEITVDAGSTLQFSYVGYVTVKIPVENPDKILNVKLQPERFVLDAAVVHAKTNPAHRIINNAIAGRKRHNPDNRRAYSCMVYNKMRVDYSIDSALLASKRSAAAQAMIDDTSSYAMIMESVMEREYKRPGNVNENIVSSQVSGFKNYQQLAFFPPLIQLFHFYDEVLEWKLINKFYLNPISPGSTSKYMFLLRDTIVSGVDSTFIISYEPKRTSNFEGLKGLLYINSNGWAIQNVVAEPADKTLMHLKIRQQYSRTDSAVWFPSELSFELFFENVLYTGITGIYRGNSYISEVNLNPDLRDKQIKSKNITLADDAHKHPEIIGQYRKTGLTVRDSGTYTLLKDVNLDYMFQLMEGIVDNEALSIWKFDLPLNRLVNENYYEGFRYGAGLYTNRHLSPWFSVGGYCGYGTKDRRSKYGASLSVFPEKHRDSELKLWYQNDIAQTAMSEEAGFSAGKLFGKVNASVSFKVQELKTLFDYSFDGGDNLRSTGFRNAEATLKLRYAVNEQRIKMFRKTMPVVTTSPVLYLNLAAGIPDCFDSRYRYYKAEMGIERTWFIRNFGYTTFSLWGGLTDGDAPLPLLFNMSYNQQSIFIGYDSRTRFNVLLGEVYSANRYVNAFLYHDFGRLLWKTRSRIFCPRIIVSQAAGLSMLENRDRHASESVPINDMRDGYFESGIIVEDLVRINLFNMMYLGVGGGVYGAYGGSVQKSFTETLTPKIRISATF
jgi:hypothetical protein